VSPEAEITAEGATYTVATIDVPRRPRRESGAVITRQDFALLREGPPSARFSARRDVLAGIATSSLIGGIGIMVTGQFFNGVPGGGMTPNWLTWGFTFVLLLGAVAAGGIARFAHRDAKASAAGMAYAACTEAIVRQFET
jgi:hypothetical protein